MSFGTSIQLVEYYSATKNAVIKKYLLKFMFIGKKSGFPGHASHNEPTCQCRRHEKCGLNPLVMTIPWTRNGKPLLYSCLGNPMDRGAWQATVHGVSKSQTRLKQLSIAHAKKKNRKTICTELDPLFMPFLILCFYLYLYKTFKCITMQKKKKEI